MRNNFHVNFSHSLVVIFLALSYLFALAPWVSAESYINVDYEGQPQKVFYDFYIPPGHTRKLYPVLVCVGGLPIINDEYVYSSTQECMDDIWKKFAQENHLAILGLGFLFIPEHWSEKSSYQYPQAWSGKALLEILDFIKSKSPINTDELYLFGISAGAQYSIRIAQMYPSRVKAVAAHAAGGYDSPREYIPVKFLVTVGELDNEPISRREFVEVFFQECREQGIDIQKKIIPKLAHQQTDEQNEMSRDFFSKQFLRQNKI